MCRFQPVLLIVKRLRCKTDKLLGFWGVTLLVSTLLAACFESDPRVERLFPLFIDLTDLPPGWYRDKTAGGIGRHDRESEGIISRSVQFRGTRNRELMEVHVWQELIDYPDQDRAARAYAEIVEEEVPTENWIWPEQIQFASRADQFLLVCLDLQATFSHIDQRDRESHACTAVGRYGNIVSVIYVNVFEDQWLTFDDLQRLLEAADERLVNGTNQP